jgi:polar amino acid transport system substrate-binding protein
METVPPRTVEQLAPTGRLRATINFGNPVLAQRDPATGEPRGVSVDLARELGRRLGVPVDLVTFEAAGKAFAALQSGACDVGFLAVDPARAAELAFTAPYVLIEGTYIVPTTSPLREVEDVDREGVRIAAGKNAAYDLHLSRTLRHAKLVYAPTSHAALELFLSEGLDAAAGVRQPLLAFAKAHPELRVMEGRFMAIEQAIATPKDRPQAAEYLRGFIEELKASGFVAASLSKSGQGDAAVAPPA